MESSRVAITLRFKGSCWLSCLESWQRKTSAYPRGGGGKVQLAATGCSGVVLQSCHLCPLSCTHIYESSRPPYWPSHYSTWLQSKLETMFCFAEMGPPHHHPGHRMPHPGINEHPPWAGPQHPDFGPPPHGFNGQPPHMRRQGPPHINHDDPSLVPNVPYFDLPAGLMAPLVKVILDRVVGGSVWWKEGRADVGLGSCLAAVFYWVAREDSAGHRQ